MKEQCNFGSKKSPRTQEHVRSANSPLNEISGIEGISSVVRRQPGTIMEIVSKKQR